MFIDIQNKHSYDLQHFFLLKRGQGCDVCPDDVTIFGCLIFHIIYNTQNLAKIF